MPLDDLFYSKTHIVKDECCTSVSQEYEWSCIGNEMESSDCRAGSDQLGGTPDSLVLGFNMSRLGSLRLIKFVRLVSLRFSGQHSIERIGFATYINLKFVTT